MSKGEFPEYEMDYYVVNITYRNITQQSSIYLREHHQNIRQSSSLLPHPILDYPKYSKRFIDFLHKFMYFGVELMNSTLSCASIIDDYWLLIKEIKAFNLHLSINNQIEICFGDKLFTNI
ncbi:CLUMA_CG019166, isoform A [Clunio marinus]|uniref:CLUMA_CG019166, isoform A n=1 Tax=Clunio marinus TaxID=568069 RepID=A0A1J1J1X3_9DIPT|nr:CLUMA_CG019166, isoform A [Clunio marinus]